MSSRSIRASKTRWRSRPVCGSSARGHCGNTLGAEQHALTDPDFRAQAMLGSRLSALEVQRLHSRRGELGSQMRQVMQRFDLLVTPTLAVPACDAKPAGHSPMDPKAMLGWTPFSYPFNLTRQPLARSRAG